MLHRTIASLAILIAIAGPGGAAPPDLCVNPGGTGGCFASVQAAVDAAASKSVIHVEPGTYVGNLSIPAIRGGITIAGAGAALTVIQGDPTGDAITVPSRGELALRDLTVAGAQYDGIHLEDRTKLAVTGCVLRDNGDQAIGTLYSAVRARVTIVDSVIAGNLSFFSFDAITLSVGSRLDVIRSSIADNAHGAVHSYGRVDLTDSVVRDNGGGLLVSSGTILRSTISGNTHGGIGVEGRTLKLVDSTVSDNGDSGVVVVAPSTVQLVRTTVAGNGGIGLFVQDDAYSEARAVVQSSILADNALADCDNDGGDTRLRLVGPNLIEASACPFVGQTPIATDPLLGPLQDNGGPTETRALLPGSPAIAAAIKSCKGTDQRGVARATPCDLGAYEAP
ncbi:MAG: choice-of-anchor Q domain-containing protein [Candidatus Binatia bacterium]